MPKPNAPIRLLTAAIACLLILAMAPSFLVRAQSTGVTINEIRIDQPSTDNDEYFELSGPPGASLDGLTYLVIGDGSGGSGVIEAVVDLSGQVIPTSGFFVAAESTFSLGTADLTANLNFENSDNVTHLLVSGFSGANGQDLDTDDDGVLDATPWTGLIDLIALIEEPNPPSGTEFHYGPPSVGPDGSFVPGQVYRCGSEWRIGPFSPGVFDTPGQENICLQLGACSADATPIHTVQGNSLSSPLVGNPVVVEGVVVGDFVSGLNGYFLQEEAGQQDSDPMTSEGIFIESSGLDVEEGQVVRVLGLVEEFFDRTQLSPIIDEAVCASGTPPSPVVLSLPVGEINELEPYEGMYVTFPQALYIAEFFNFDRFGEIVLTTDRQYQPTAVEEPGTSAAAAVAQANALSRITLDDGRSFSNPDPAIHPNGAEFTLLNRFRGGDTVQNVTGVMDYGFGLYRIQPTEGADYTAANPRPTDAPDVGGSMQVAAFNVLNYFTTIDTGAEICGPSGDLECRGADDTNELMRQRAKIVAALSDLEADVVGLIEIENDGMDQSVADLVVGLNDILGSGTYDYISTGFIGTDAIKQAFIYKPGTVTPVGNHAVLDSNDFVDPNNLGEPKNRPALAQSFMDNATGGTFTAVVNHFKSKGSPCGAGDDDTVQGNCNLTRTLAAEVLVEWLATDPTASGDTDFLIIGDLNSYDHEDPIDVLRDAGYTDLLLQYQGENAYSYVFDGQLGYLDYALANSAFLPEISGTEAWHINTDEPDILDYDTTFKQDPQDALYEPNAFRSSDHDPVITGLTVCEDETAPSISLSVSPDTLWPANHKYVDVTVSLNVSDDFDPTPTITLLSVTSNEPDDGLGDGDTAEDILILDDLNFQLRAERSGTGEGRIYTITYQATDRCGNATVESIEVVVPKNQGKDK